MAIPDDLLLAFFREATAALNEYKQYDGTKDNDATILLPPPLVEQRQHLLALQRSCLERVVTRYNEEDSSGTTPVTKEKVQAKLKELGGTEDQQLKEAMGELNDAARLAFCRVVLKAECDWDARENKEGRQLRKREDGPMERSAIIEFCSLCSTAVRLPNVQQYLRGGAALYEDSTIPVSSIEEETEPHISERQMPQKRMEQVQRLLIRAVGYDPDYATAEIQRIFFTDNPDGFIDDLELHDTFSRCVSSLRVAVTNASLQDNDGDKLSDHDNGGVTRVVSVQYSERIVSNLGEQTVGAPSAESIQEQVEERQQQDLLLARQAAALQQGILGELLSMNEQDREANLRVAKEAHDSFLKGALELPAGPERVEYLRSVDPETQRLLVMHKLWMSMMADQGGIAPTIRHSE